MKIASILVLAIGLSVAAGIYLFAPEEDEAAAMYDLANSKQYNRTLRQFGGKASVLFDDVQRWFAARWQGKQLGVTIGWLSAGTALVLYLASRRGK
ncbi:hypothetical protein AYO46_08770 [Betaproteobacteria bacterium SCGC AG-212-J23]|nr:hypothetical protein AYO46_08770 [Betaproteobacteria bacterium SCGC AG-212-J23]